MTGLAEARHVPCTSCYNRPSRCSSLSLSSSRQIYELQLSALNAMRISCSTTYNYYTVSTLSDCVGSKQFGIRQLPDPHGRRAELHMLCCPSGAGQSMCRGVRTRPPHFFLQLTDLLTAHAEVQAIMRASTSKPDGCTPEQYS